MESPLVQLGKEIYYNYRKYVSDGTAYDTCKQFLTLDRVKGFVNDDENIMMIEIGDITYINTTFSDKIFLYANEAMDYEQDILSQICEMKLHRSYLYIFTFLCLSNKRFIEDYKKIYVI